MHIQYRSLGTERFCHRKSVLFSKHYSTETVTVFWYNVEDKEHEIFKTFLNVALDTTNNLKGNHKCKFKSSDFILPFTSLYYWQKTIYDDACMPWGITCNYIKIQNDGAQIDKVPDFTASTLMVKPAPGVWDFWLLNRIRNGDASPVFVWL